MPFEKNINHPENSAFLAHLKECSSNVIDKLVSKIAKEETAKIDCTTCGNCCKNMHPAMQGDDIERIATELNTTPTRVLEKYSEYDTEKKMSYMKASPCSFLAENKCTIYNARPLSCQDYPHLTQPHFKYRIKQIMYNYTICPIVYNTLETLKLEMNK